VELARQGELLGFDRVVYGDHLLLPTALDAGAYPYAATSPLPATIEYGDPIVVAGAVLTAAPRLEFLTGVYLLPMHHPLVAARAAITVQKISNGRLLLGTGSGWMREEYDAINLEFERRGERFDEALQVVRAACQGGRFSHDGAHFSFPEITITSRPTFVPLVVGGGSRRALRRAAEYGDGWYSTPDMDLRACVAAREQIEVQRQALGTDGRAFAYYIRLPRPHAGELDQFTDEGFTEFSVGRAQLFPNLNADLEEKVGSLAAIAETFGLEPRGP